VGAQILKVVTTIGAGLLAVVVVAELVAGLLIPSSGGYPAELFIDDIRRGLQLRPGAAGLVTVAGHEFEVEVNSDGYRDPEWSTISGTPRVLLVGSSTLFGVGLPLNEGIAAQLRAQMPEAAIFSTGVYSYGPPQILDTLKAECPRVLAGVVVYVMDYKSTRTDFQEQRHIPGGASEARVSASWKLDALRALLSANYLHPTQLWEQMVGLSGKPAETFGRYLVTADRSLFPTAAIGSAAATIVAMQAAATSCGADFLLVPVPGPSEAYYGIKEPAVQELLALVMPRVKVLDTREETPAGSRYHLSWIDYLNRDGVSWVATKIADAMQAN
jgi:hypothetical protein